MVVQRKHIPVNINDDKNDYCHIDINMFAVATCLHMVCSVHSADAD